MAWLAGVDADGARKGRFKQGSTFNGSTTVAIHAKNYPHTMPQSHETSILFFDVLSIQLCVSDGSIGPLVNASNRSSRNVRS